MNNTHMSPSSFLGFGSISRFGSGSQHTGSMFGLDLDLDMDASQGHSLLRGTYHNVGPSYQSNPLTQSDPLPHDDIHFDLTIT